MRLLQGPAATPLYLDADAPVSRGRLRAASHRLASHLVAAKAVLNLCEDRAAFACGLLAAGLRQLPTLLPPARDAQTLADLLREYPGTAIVADSEQDLPAILVDAQAILAAAGEEGADVSVNPEAIAVIAHTSGSTGTPKALPKRWLSFAGVAERMAQRFGAGEPPALVATVPPQHMYGLECSVLMPLLHGWPVHRGRPFFPADILEALTTVAAPRMLVSTPVHLKALLNAGPVKAPDAHARLAATDAVACPELAAVISATAPMPVELAAQLEATLAAPCLEIYGCTETGAVASRRSIDGPVWTLFEGIRIEADDDGGVLHSDHLPAAERLPDLLDVEDGQHFRLIGRPQDMINVAGRRYSVAELTRRILEISGVQDAAVLVPDRGDGHEPRPAAAVVAPGMDARRLRAELGLRIDPVFLPRPLRLVEAIPRNATGKVRRDDLQALLRD